MLVTVSICTWNRSRLLRETLRRMAQLVIPSGIEWELVVVDNNSTDSTPEVIREFMSVLPLHSAVEMRPGVSHARNTAMAHSHGVYTLCTDDDVLVDPQWLAAYVEAFERYGDAVVFGGPILPWFEGDPPPWLRSVFDKVDAAYAARSFDGGDLPLSEANMAFGANMAFRTDILKQHTFDPALGRVNAGLLGGEETTMVRAILQAGNPGWWVSGARVQHYIPRARQSVKYLREWYAGYGRTMVRLDARLTNGQTGGRPRWVWRELVVSELIFMFRRMWAPPSVWIDDLKRAGTARGQFGEFGGRQLDAPGAARWRSDDHAGGNPR
jgi:glycosyltransferase involved in cell wall biosynthesis